MVGADADLAIIHPTATRTVSPSTMETNADWSPYEGWELAGFARTTLSRGEVIVDRYAVVGPRGPRAVAAAHAARGSRRPARAVAGARRPRHRPVATRVPQRPAGAR